MSKLMTVVGPKKTIVFGLWAEFIQLSIFGFFSYTPYVSFPQFTFLFTFVRTICTIAYFHNIGYFYYVTVIRYGISRCTGISRAVTVQLKDYCQVVEHGIHIE